MYLKESLYLGLCLSSGGATRIVRCFGANWGQKRPSQLFINRFIIMCAGGLVHWESKQKSVVAKSTKKSAFIVVATFIEEVM